MSMTVTIQIGNTDDKLTQREWSAYVLMVKELILFHCVQVHFFGGSSNWEIWQNACWVIEAHESQLPPLRTALTDARKCFDQVAVAITVGTAEFV